MVELTAPDTILVGHPFTVGFRSDTRVAGRIRITAGTEAISFVLERGDRPPESSAAHRVRGKQGTFRVRDWGEHPEGAELVLRFEGAKKWMTVARGDAVASGSESGE